MEGRSARNGVATCCRKDISRRTAAAQVGDIAFSHKEAALERTTTSSSLKSAPRCVTTTSSSSREGDVALKEDERRIEPADR